MLPFLKNKQEASASSDVEHMKRTPDDGEPFDMLDAIAEDMMNAMEKKDKKLLKSCLEALLEHVQDMDQVQDAELAE